VELLLFHTTTISELPEKLLLLIFWSVKDNAVEAEDLTYLPKLIGVCKQWRLIIIADQKLLRTLDIPDVSIYKFNSIIVYRFRYSKKLTLRVTGWEFSSTKPIVEEPLLAMQDPCKLPLIRSEMLIQQLSIASGVELVASVVNW